MRLYHFTADEVKHPLFICAWKTWYADYATMGWQPGGTNHWWQNDGEPFVRGFTGTTIRCTRGVSSKALLLCARIHNPNSMRDRVGVCTAKLLDTAFAYNLPGCKDVQSAFNHMNKAISEDEQLQCRALRNYYLSVGCEEVACGRGRARAAGGRLPAIQRVRGGSGAVAERYEQSGRRLD